MMIISIITLIISLLIQGIISNYQGYIFSNLSIFYTIYPLIALMILLPYFNNNKKYLATLIIFGLIIDIAYTNTFILNTFIFLVAYYFNKIFHSIIPYNLLTINISSIISIIIYHFLSFVILSIISYDKYTGMMLLNSITHSIIMTIIYTSIIYLLIDYINKKFNLKEVK